MRAQRGLIYLSGAGADEIISDYSRNGVPIYDAQHSGFNGVFPANLSTIFPWGNFYFGSQRAFLMKEELTSGAHGVEGRYPFLDPHVVQVIEQFPARYSQWAALDCLTKHARGVACCLCAALACPAAPPG